MQSLQATLHPLGSEQGDHWRRSENSFVVKTGDQGGISKLDDFSPSQVKL